MTCRGFISLLLKVINVLFTLVGLAMIGYGIYMVVMYENSSSSTSPPPPPLSPSPPPPPPPLPSPPPLSPPPPPSSSPAVPSPPPPSPPPPSSSPAVPSPSPPSPPSPPPPPPSPPSPDESVLRYRARSSLNMEKERMDSSMGVLQLRRALFQKDSTFQLNAVSSFWSNLSTAWFLYVFIGVGVVIVLITCSGCIAASITNGCCLCCYSLFVGLVMIVELGIAAFIFFYKSWQDVIPEDSTGELDSIEDFIDDNFDILKWVGLGILILQAVAVLLAIILRALGSNVRTDYDSDDEYLATRSSRQPLLNRQTATGTAANVAGSENQSARTDTWSTRMREKYGLDMKDFKFKPTTEPTRSSQSAGEKSWCSIM